MRNRLKFEDFNFCNIFILRKVTSNKYSIASAGYNLESFHLEFSILVAYRNNMSIALKLGTEFPHKKVVLALYKSLLRNGQELEKELNRGMGFINIAQELKAYPKVNVPHDTFQKNYFQDRISTQFKEAKNETDPTVKNLLKYDSHGFSENRTNDFWRFCNLCRIK
jgi:hypothetical protein